MVGSADKRTSTTCSPTVTRNAPSCGFILVVMSVLAISLKRLVTPRTALAGSTSTVSSIPQMRWRTTASLAEGSI